MIRAILTAIIPNPTHDNTAIIANSDTDHHNAIFFMSFPLPYPAIQPGLSSVFNINFGRVPGVVDYFTVGDAPVHFWAAAWAYIGAAAIATPALLVSPKFKLRVVF